MRKFYIYSAPKLILSYKEHNKTCKNINIWLHIQYVKTIVTSLYVERAAGRAAVALLVGAVLVGWNQMWIPKLPATGELRLVSIDTKERCIILCRTMWRCCPFGSFHFGGAGGILLGGALDDAHGDGLPHVTHGETSQGREVDERLHAQRLGGDEGDNGGVTGLDELGVVLKLLA